MQRNFFAWSQRDATEEKEEKRLKKKECQEDFMCEKDTIRLLTLRCRRSPARAEERPLGGKGVHSFLSARKQGPPSHKCKEQILLVT